MTALVAADASTLTMPPACASAASVTLCAPTVFESWRVSMFETLRNAPSASEAASVTRIASDPPSPSSVGAASSCASVAWMTSAPVPVRIDVEFAPSVTVMS